MKALLAKLASRVRDLPKVTLKRIDDDGVTVGKLILPSGNKLFTIEPPWKRNRQNVSCIPTGIYLCKKSKYNAGGYMTFEIMDVEDRTNIKLHKGNFDNDTKGCPLINDMIGADHDKLRGVSSGQAFREFWDEMSKFKEFVLEIK